MLLRSYSYSFQFLLESRSSICSAYREGFYASDTRVTLMYRYCIEVIIIIIIVFALIRRVARPALPPFRVAVPLL